MAIVKKPFTITSENGTMMFNEGQTVAKEVADKFPQFMEGYAEAKAHVHNPNLPLKISKAQAERMTEASLMAWIEQYHPGQMPKDKLTKADLVALVLELQSE